MVDVGIAALLDSHWLFSEQIFQIKLKRLIHEEDLFPPEFLHKNDDCSDLDDSDDDNSEDEADDGVVVRKRMVTMVIWMDAAGADENGNGEDDSDDSRWDGIDAIDDSDGKMLR